MSDLIKRLRGLYSCGPDGIKEDRDFGSYTPAICSEAADKIQSLESEIELYKKALTMAVQLPMGCIPHGEGFYTQMDNGVCVVKKESDCE